MLKEFFLVLGSMFIIILMLIMIISVTGCTYSINMVHTEGTASDVVDETDEVEPEISPTLSIPLK